MIGHARIQGCVGILAAQSTPKSSVVFVGDAESSRLFGPSFRSTFTLPTTVATLRDSLNKRTINHVACGTKLTDEFLNDALLDVPETFSYQVWTDLIHMPGSMLPHVFEIYLGKLISLSITTFVPTPLPNDRFFSYWRSTKDLMNAAARSVNLKVVINNTGESETKKKTTTNYWGQSWQQQQQVRAL